MCDRVVGFDGERLAIALNGLVPGFVARKFDARAGGRFRRFARKLAREEQTQSQQKHH